jgi:hypothetical protein
MKKRLLHPTSIAIVVTWAWLAAGCATTTPEELAQQQNELDTMAEESVAALIKKNPDLQSVFDDAVGYMVVDMKLTKVPIVGAGGGKGVVVDKVNNKRTYVSVKRLDLGGGWGVRAFKAIFTFTDKEKLADAAGGRLAFQAGAEAAAGGASAEGSTGAMTKGFETYVLSEGGASATVTVRAIRLKSFSETTK